MKKGEINGARHSKRPLKGAFQRDPAEAEDYTYREIFDGVNDLILVHDPETGEILDANSKCLEFGFSLEELRRMGVSGFSPKGEEYSPERIGRLIGLAACGEPQIFEWGFYDSKGTFHPTEVNLKLAVIKGKNRLLAIVRDITERKEAQREIEQAKESFHNIVDKCSDGMIVVDMKGIVRFVNPAAGRLCNSLKKDMVGRPLSHPITSLKEGHIEIVRQNGEPGIGEIRMTDTEWEGREGYLLSIRDVTETQKLIGELQQALGKIQTLKGLLPICSYCKKVRDDKGYWEQIETYITQHTDAEFTHGLCPECAAKIGKKQTMQDDT